jgi:hypothetical protein
VNHIFITGFWRSGTSLMLRLLDGHPQVCAMPHMTGMITMLEKYPDFLANLRQCTGPHQLLALLGHHSVVSNFRHLLKASFEGMSFTDEGERYPFDFDFERFALHFLHTLRQSAGSPTELRQVSLGYCEAIREGWTNCASRSGERVFARHQGHRNHLFPGEDTVDFVVRHIPDMVIAEIVRDPVFQIGSALRADSALSLENAIVHWTFAYNHARNCLKLHPGRYALYRYEDLVAEPARIMGEIAGRMGIAFDPCLLTPTFNAQPWRGNSQFAPKEKLEARTQPKMDPASVAYIQKSLRVERGELGYKAFDPEALKTDQAGA